MAGLKCYRIMNENTATALAFGITRTDLPEGDPMYVTFVDLGHASLQVRVVTPGSPSRYFGWATSGYFVYWVY